MKWETAVAISVIVVNSITSLFAFLAWWKARRVDELHKEIKKVTTIINGHDRDG